MKSIVALFCVKYLHHMRTTKKVKIAYLISVHTDAIQLGRMIRALYQGDDTYFFIHVDAKCNQADFETVIPEMCKKNVLFTCNRYWIQWGGFNQVLYQRELLSLCLSSKISFDRIFLLTGQDYPLISNEDINKELSENPSKEYIIGLNISDIDNPSKIKKKLVLYHFFRDLRTSYKIKKIFSGISRIIMTILPIRKKTYLVIDGVKWPVYQSSAMMCITYTLANYILEKLSDKQIVNYFRYSFAPDEMVLPTIIFNSPYRKNCLLYEKESYDGLKTLSAITYFNYGKEIQIFTLSNYDELKNCGKMFARKFVTDVSDSLMDKLDNEHGL